MKYIKAIGLVLCAALCVSMASPVAFAKTAKNNPVADPAEQVESLQAQKQEQVQSSPVPIQAPVAVTVATPQPTAVLPPVQKEPITGYYQDGYLVHEESFGTDFYLKGTNASLETTFHVGEWLVHGVELNLLYSASQFLDETTSAFTVLINGVRCATQRNPVTYGERSQLKVRVPATELKVGVNTLAIEADILVSGTSPTSASSIQSGWMNVFRDSAIAIAYEPLNPMQSIADFYAAFTSIESLDYKKSVVATCASPDNAELASAMYAMAGMSKNALTFYQNLQFKATSDLQELQAYENVLYICGYANLPQPWKDQLSPEQTQYAQSDAIVTLLQTPKQRVLLVTGQTQALETAGKMMANQPLLEQWTGKSRVVLPNERYDLPAQPFEQYRVLSPGGTMLWGDGSQSVQYYISFPYNRRLSEKSQLYLVYRYADNLDFTRSMMTVFINDKPIASKRLSKIGAAQDESTFGIPIDLDITGNFVLKVSFDLYTESQAQQEANPWAFIANTSTLKINSVTQPFLVFENYPSPFMRDGAFNDILVVIPATPTQEEYAVLAQTFCLFGRYLQSTAGKLWIVREDTNPDTRDRNVISIGTFANNRYTQSLNKDMFFQFSQDGRYLLSNEKMVIDPAYSRQLGTGQLLRASDQSDKAVLVLSGTTPQGLLNAAAYLKTTDSLWKVYADGFVADSENIFNHKFKQDNAKTLSIASKLKGRTDITALLIILGLLGTLVIIACVFLYAKYTKGANAHERQ